MSEDYMTPERIERLKKNRLPIKYLPEDDAKCLIKANKESETLFLDNNGGWGVRDSWGMYKNSVYRIHKDYQPPPEKLWIWAYKCNDNWTLNTDLFTEKEIIEDCKMCGCSAYKLLREVTAKDIEVK